MSTTTHSELDGAIGPVARALFGTPTSRSTRDLLYFGSNNGSLEVDLQNAVWFDHTLNKGGKTIDLAEHGLHSDRATALAWIEQQRFVSPRASTGMNIVATYDYRSINGALLFQVCRLSPKDFRQRRPDGAGWSWKTKGVERVPYRLPELLGASPVQQVFIVEGEKDVDRLRSAGFVATCNAGGAATSGQKSKWPNDFAKYFQDRDVVIIPDNDDAGLAHAYAIADSLTKGARQARSVRILYLPDLTEKGDVSDWFDAGGTPDALLDLVSDAMPFARDALTDRSDHKTLDLQNGTAIADFELHEDGVALAFAETYRGKLLYDHQACHWYLWTGTVWKMERTKLAFSWARQVCRNAACKLEPDDRVRSLLAKASAAAAVERFAMSDRAFAVEADIWNQDPWLLGTPGGTVDLRTGLTKAADAADRISKTVLVAPAPAGSVCPVWDRFLDEVTNYDKAFQTFIQRSCGYCLTGEVNEEVLWFVYGEGGTGKGTLLRTIVSIMADYALSVPIEVFTAGSKINLEYYRAEMAGTRLVTASETEKGATWAEAQIKEMTGNEAPLSGRQPYGKVFTYRPKFKLLLVGNHAPRLKGRSKAMERRLRIAPFKHKPLKEDKTLKERIEAEYPAILRWMIDGCLEWQRDGLGSCSVVDAASSNYFEDQDSFGDWLRERCLVAPSLSEQPGSLLADYLKWAKENNEAQMTKNDFKELIERTPSLVYSRSGGSRRVKGIGLRPTMADQDAERARYGD